MRPAKEDPVGGHCIKPRAVHTAVAIRAHKTAKVVALHDQQIVSSLLRHGQLLGSDDCILYAIIVTHIAGRVQTRT